MAAKVGELLAERAKGEIQVGGTSLGFQFFVLWRERFSEEEWTALLAMNGREYVKTLLPRVLVSWDLVDDDGHAVPVTADAIEQHHIPDRVLFEIERRALASDLSGKVPTSSNSPAT